MKRKIKSMIKSFLLLFKRKKIIPVNYIIDTNAVLDGKVALITGGGWNWKCYCREVYCFRMQSGNFRNK